MRLFIPIFMAVFFMASPVFAQAQCDKYRNVVANLKANYQESPTARGLTQAGAVLEIFVSDKGTWTAIMVNPGGIACFYATGENWESGPLIKGTPL